MHERKISNMLTTCPECELPVSDKALTCPHCGYPLKETNIQRSKTSRRKIRLPNGFGQISEIKNKNLRNPYRVMITTGKNSEGRPICKLLKPQAYFKTYNEAYQALVEYNKNPYDLDDDIRLSELYERWSDVYFETLKADSSKRTIKACWSRCSEISNMRVKDIRARHIKACMDKTESANLKIRVKSMFNLMLDYALEYEIVDRNYARTFEISNDVVDELETMKRAHLSFTDEEISSFVANRNIPFVELVIYQILSGWRPQELGLILVKNVDLEQNIIVGGMKTDAGTDRIVPIHPYVREFIKRSYDQAIAENREYLFCDERGKKLTYDKYQKRFRNVITALGMNPDHRPHDPRKQFVTIAKRDGVDEYALKRIVGHKIDDITEKVYTDRPISWLVGEMEKIKSPVLIAKNS